MAGSERGGSEQGGKGRELCTCVRVCVRACVRACFCVCACVRVCERGLVIEPLSSLALAVLCVRERPGVCVRERPGH